METEKKKTEISDEDKETIFTLAKELTGFCCPTGFEDEIRRYLVDRLKNKCAVETDAMGNVIATVQGTSAEPRRRLLLTAHMDEIGFMLSYITKDGFLRVAPLGSQDNRILPGQRVVAFSDKGEYRGVIAEKPIHLQDDDERKRVVKDDDIFIDIGASSKEDVNEILAIGDYVTFQRQCEWLGPGHLISCKAGDDRMGVLVLLLVLEHLILDPPAWDVIGVFSTQEEAGARGITVSAYNVSPDAAIVLETGHAIDYPGISKDKFGDIELGNGPAISIGPNLHPRFAKFIIKTAQDHDIPYQVKVDSGVTSTDARQVQVTRKGVATGLIRVPLRYMHTNVEVFSPADVQQAIYLLENVVESLPVDFPVEI
ncbi:MAG TPA: M42 family peptidase [Candidatus Lokiarchaeia archaeon]|nr:M42 family peptidase [Candidatus Lokiarchaeia archaeon]